jgi:hypothetical protein
MDDHLSLEDVFKLTGTKQLDSACKNIRFWTLPCLLGAECFACMELGTHVTWWAEVEQQRR